MGSLLSLYIHTQSVKFTPLPSVWNGGVCRGKEGSGGGQRVWEVLCPCYVPVHHQGPADSTGTAAPPAARGAALRSSPGCIQMKSREQPLWQQEEPQSPRSLPTPGGKQGHNMDTTEGDGVVWNGTEGSVGGHGYGRGQRGL